MAFEKLHFMKVLLYNIQHMKLQIVTHQREASIKREEGVQKVMLALFGHPLVVTRCLVKSTKGGILYNNDTAWLKYVITDFYVLNGYKCFT